MDGAIYDFGLAMGPLAMGDLAYVVVRLYLYGDRAPAAVERDEPAWRAWIDRHFPSTGTT